MKRGMSTLLREFIAIVIGIMVLLTLLTFSTNLYGFFSSNEGETATGMLSNVKNNIEAPASSTADNNEIYVYNPEGLYFMTFSQNKGAEGVNVPEKCFNANCICICDSTCKDTIYCMTITKPLIMDSKNIKLQIPASFIVTETASAYIAGSTGLALSEGKGNVAVNTDKTKLNIPGLKVIYSYTLSSKERTDLSKVKYLVLHHTGGDDFQGAYDTLVQRGLSVHYMIDKAGTVYSLVDEKRMAFHALGFNDVSIGIEIVNSGSATDQYTDAQYNSINLLAKDIASRWNIPYGDANIIGHYQTPAGNVITVDGTLRKWDPSPNFQWARIGLPNHAPVNIAYVPKSEGYTSAGLA